MQLRDVVKRAKPDILIGLSTVKDLFTEEILAYIADNQEPGRRPLIFPMSNPTSCSECTAEATQRATRGRAIFASGSPFPDVEYDGRVIASSQSNNMYFFPGVALGAQLGHTKVVSDRMLMAAAEAIPEQLTAEDIARGRVYPKLHNIREISANIAVRVMQAAYEDGHLYGKAKRRLEAGEVELKRFILDMMFDPKYKDLVYRDPGVGE
uniref:Malate oxidoreductase n=1 Tax=Tetraselmis sp. GSL018 TaxID=582737 RepID=A0A061RS61_9CHLO